MRLPNLLKEPYPMFKTTPEEKELLRKAEFWYVNHPNNFYGLCSVLFDHLRAGISLRDKVSGNWFYIDLSLFSKEYIYYIDNIPLAERRKIRSAVRRIWINKLLNYTGE